MSNSQSAMTETLRPEAVAELAAKATPNVELVYHRDIADETIPCLRSKDGKVGLEVNEYGNDADVEFYLEALPNWPLHAARLLEVEAENGRLRTLVDEVLSKAKRCRSEYTRWAETETVARFDDIVFLIETELAALAPKVTP